MARNIHMTCIAVTVGFIAATGGAQAHGSVRAAGIMKPDGTSHWTGESGAASYYGPSFNGRRSASGMLFNQEALTAAHPWLPFGKKIAVKLTGTNRTVTVTITDRLPPNHRVVDLSLAAARRLGIIHRGLAKVTLTPA